MHRSVRLPADMYGRLVQQSNRFGCSKAEVFRKALRKWDRKFGKGVVISENPHSTTETVVYRGGAPEHLLEGRSAADIRVIVDWYLGILEVTPDPAPLKVDPAEVETMKKGANKYQNAGLDVPEYIAKALGDI